MSTAANSRRKYVHPFKEKARIDPYRSDMKPKGSPRCPTCQSVHFRGRWLSKSQISARANAPVVSGQHPCPACRQLQDHFALGVVEIRGMDWKTKWDLIEKTLRRGEKIARFRNDQERILWIQNAGDIAKIYVTLPELARRLGRELEKSFQGVVEYERTAEEPYLRVRWWTDLPHMAHRSGVGLGIKRASKIAGRPRLESVHRSKSSRGRGRI